MNESRMKDLEWIMNDKQAKSKFQGVSPVERRYIYIYIYIYIYNTDQQTSLITVNKK